MSIDAPVFIVGCPRSGTTLLQRMLDALPGVAIAPETHFIRRFWFRRGRYGDLSLDESYGRLIHDVVAMPEFADMGLDPEAFRDAAFRQTRGYGELFGLLLTQYAAGHDAGIVGEKTPNHLLYMQTLETLFPLARFVHLVRDPRGVVNSWRSVPWSSGSVSRDAMVWRRYLATARRRPPRRRDRLLTVRYEDLLAEPVASVQRICRFIGADPNAVVDATGGVVTGGVDVDREPWKANALRPLNPKRQDAWSNELTDEQIARIEAVTWVEMIRWGYRPRTTRVKLMAGAVRVWGDEGWRRVRCVLRAAKP